jgi:hypothetical protein
MDKNDQMQKQENIGKNEKDKATHECVLSASHCIITYTCCTEKFTTGERKHKFAVQ